MRKLSNGKDSTLGEYKKIAIALFGENSKPVNFLNEKIIDQGENEEVLADERQMLNLLFNLRK